MDTMSCMIIISDGDGQDNRTQRVAAADAAKADDVTIFAFGFNGIQADRMKEISGNSKGTCGVDCTRVASGGLAELTNFIEERLCATFLAIMPPDTTEATPAPTDTPTVQPTPTEQNRTEPAGIMASSANQKLSEVFVLSLATLLLLFAANE